ncbi:MAG: glycosyltransferase family 4 protein [Selenomonas ruminantium]|uniref:Glycosyltransferase family 4 protein n=1 Tax=Selenomonas ruminantium TaxID=971 RepID=A0A927ZRK2_SELRU|nr:glycosyltransferase family 4 protein [Selenomonas ruminantium]
MNFLKKICHLTSAHTQEDIRIFHKECVSLADAGYEVYQISCGNTYDKKGVHLIGIGVKPVGRLARMRKTAMLVYQAALKVDADVYHIHDPELLPYGLKLKRLGKKVIFDSHEDIPAQIMDKEYIAKPLRKIVSAGYKVYESYVIKHLDAVVAATPHIAEKFQNRCRKVVTVNNYPRLDDIQFHETPFTEREPIICYAGGISEIRGEKIMTEAMQNVNGTLILAGDSENVSPPRGQNT